MPSPGIDRLVNQLLAGEPAGAQSSNGDVDLAVRACERLRIPLAKLAGAAGFSSLLSRALALAKRQVPSLERLRIEADGSLVGSDEIPTDMGAADAARGGGVVLLAELLGLLVTFIGEPLTLSLLREAWPDAPPGSMTFSNEDTP